MSLSGNGILRRCRRACFAKRAERTADSATERREALSGAHGALRPTFANGNVGSPRRGHLTVPEQAQGLGSLDGNR